MTKFPYLFVFLIVFTIICHATKPKPADDDGGKPSPAGDQSMPDMAVFMSQCNETYNIEISYLDSLNTSGSFPDETHETPKCYMDCLLAKAGVAAAGRGFDPARAALLFGGARPGRSLEDVRAMAAECADRVAEEESGCERAYGFLKCVMQRQVERYEANDQGERQGKIDYSNK